VLAAELDMLPIAAPPLRERPEDIGALIAAALDRHGFHAEEMQSEVLAAACRAHAWPENICELERVIARLAVMSGGRRIEREDILRHSSWIMADAEAGETPRSPSPRRAVAQAGNDLWLRCAVHRDAAALQGLHEGLARALLYLGDHYAEPISLAQLARHAHVSESHISFLFRTVLNMPFKGVLGRIRIHKAREILIRDSRRQITDVALSVGFADLSHFEKCFKRLVGESPRDFRRRHAMHHAAE
ncbi:MAG: helix-turn-helix domain-containing protein, partial [Brevundimonas sp.]